MLRFQAELPRLPVPELEETCALYLRLVRPLVSGSELASTEAAVAEFVDAAGPGGVLQQRLSHWREVSAPDNWLDPFWDDWYLRDPTPLPINVSPGFALTGGGRPQIARAAALVGAALAVKRLVESEELDPDLENGTPRCMREYTRLFSSTRIPGSERDTTRRYPDSRHIVVVHEGRLFELQVLDREGRACAIADLERALRRIVEDPAPTGLPLGVLTSDGRRTWADAREAHLERGSAASRDFLESVERAILVLVLETGAAPASPRSAEAARVFLHGDGRGRWFDKSLQLVVATNGVAGFCMEHSDFDGATAVRLSELLVEHEHVQAAEIQARNDLVPRKLGVEETEPLLEAVSRSGRAVDELIARTDLVVLDFGELGKRSIVAHDLSPDAFVQMAFQLAYFTLTGEIASTYESVDTKRFLHGRTEAMRPVSEESVAFVRSLRSEGHSRATSEQLLRAAVASHRATLARCKEGRGVDRHLLGLRRMLEPGEPVPRLFTDKSYETLTRSVLSTSALPSSPGVALTCFGPVVDDGFGLSYTIHDDSVCCVVTSFHGLAGAFADELAGSLEEMQALVAGSAR